MDEQNTTDGRCTADAAPDGCDLRAPTEHAQGVLNVSVVIPTFNGSDTLSVCLAALMAQDFPHEAFEIIVVDDGSSDDTQEVVARFRGRSPDVQYYCQPNQGPAAARNNGARRAQGAIVMFTDDDCEPMKDWIRQMYKPFEVAAEEVVAVKGAYRTRQTSVVAHFAQIEFEDRYTKMLNSRYVDFVDTYAAAFRRSVFLALGGFDTSFPTANNEDVEFSYRMSEKGHKMVFNPEAVVYHTHPDSLYRYLRVKFGRAYWRMAVYRKFPGKMRGDSYTPQMLKLQIGLSCLLTISLLVNLFLHDGFAATLGLLAVFLLSTLPFMVRVLNIGVINRFIALMKRFLKRGFIRALLNRLAEAVRRSLPCRVFRAVGHGIAVGVTACLRGVRRVLKSTPVCWVGRGGVRICRLAGWLLLGAIRGLFACVRFPFTAVAAIWTAVGSALHWLAGKGWVRRLSRVLNVVGRTRLFMMLLSVIMLALRGMAMGAGVVWGLQSHTASKGRFTQVMALFCCDVLGVLSAITAAYYLRTHALHTLLPTHNIPFEFYVWHMPLVAIVVLTFFMLAGLYKPYKGLSQVNEFALITKSVFTVTLMAVVMLYLAHAPHSRTIVLLSSALAVAGITALRWFSRSVLERWTHGAHRQARRRILVVGTGEVARLICKKLQSTQDIDSLIVGLLDRDPLNIGRCVDGCEVIGSIDQLGEIIEARAVHEVFMAMPGMPQEEVMNLVDRHSAREGVHFYVVSNLFDLIAAEINITEQTNIPVAYLRNENMALLYQMMKRAFDVVVALGVILVTLPLWIVIMVAIRLETDGPALFLQDRVGKDGRQFRILKFRTMFAETNQYEYSPSTAGDRRITTVGGFLRKTSLDEFPQFINVLKGDMSLVGPRPEMPFIVEKYKDWERQRLRVKPGLTGLWQIMGRKDLPLHESLEYDFYYIKNQSLLLDITILIKTVPVILFGKGAY